MKEQIESHIKSLSFGLLQKDPKLTYSNYKSLYEIGAPAIPNLKRIIIEGDWSDSKYTQLSQYFMGIISLIYEIDESEGRAVIKEVRKNEIPVHIDALLRYLLRFSKDDFHIYKIKNIEIFEHKATAEAFPAKLSIEMWLQNLPRQDLDGISRINIVREKDISDALGNYMPFLHAISLRWYGVHYPLIRKLSLLLIELTFYHEIGHYVHRHTFGRDPEQEKEADIYASRIFRSAHPKFKVFATLLSHVILIRSKKPSKNIIKDAE